MEEKYTLTVYTENQLELINRIAVMFLRKKINLVSLNISECEIDKMHRFTIVINAASEIVQNLVHQIEKIIDVFRCYCNTEEEIFSTQTALYKLPTDRMINNESLDLLFKKYNAAFLSIEKKYTVFEVTAQENEIDNLTTILNQYELVEFVKSSKIALIKGSEGFAKELLEMENY